MNEIAAIKGGKRIPLGKTFSQVKTDYPYIRVTDFKDFSVDVKEMKYISKEVFNSIKNYIISTKDIYLSNAGTIGLVGIIPQKLESKSLTENSAKITNIKKETKQKYLMYTLGNRILQKQIDRELLIVGVPKLSLERIGTLKIPIPPKPIQEKIISLMDSAYSLKKENEEKAKNLTNSIDSFVLEKLDIAIPKLKKEMCFTVSLEELENTRIDSEFHQEKYKQIEKALENGKYGLEKLKSVCNLFTGAIVNTRDYQQEGIPLIRIQNIDEQIHFDNLKHVSFQEYQENINAQLKSGDLVFGMSGSIGKVGIVQDNIQKCLLNQRIAILRKIKTDNFYLKVILNNLISKSQFDKIGTGGIQINISSEDILNLKIPLPPLDIQKEIADEVKSRLEKAKSLKARAKENLESAKQEVECILLEN